MLICNLIDFYLFGFRLFDKSVKGKCAQVNNKIVINVICQNSQNLMQNDSNKSKDLNRCNII